MKISKGKPKIILYIKEASLFSRKTYEKYKVLEEASISNKFIIDQENIIFLLSMLTHKLKSSTDHMAKVNAVNNNILLVREFPFLFLK